MFNHYNFLFNGSGILKTLSTPHNMVAIDNKGDPFVSIFFTVIPETKCFILSPIKPYDMDPTQHGFKFERWVTEHDQQSQNFLTSSSVTHHLMSGTIENNNTTSKACFNII